MQQEQPELEEQWSQQKCASQKHCAQMIEKILKVQIQVSKLQKIAIVQCLNQLIQLFKHVPDWANALVELKRCERCTSIRIRNRIQQIDVEIAQGALFRCLNLITILKTYIEQNQLDPLKLSSPIQQRILSLQIVKKSILKISFICRMGFNSDYHYLDALPEKQSCDRQSKEPYCQIKQIEQSYQDPDPRPAVNQEQCPTFIHLPRIISHLATLQADYKEAPKPLRLKSRKYIAEQLQAVGKLLKVISDEPKCSKCRNQYFQLKMSTMLDQIQLLDNFSNQDESIHWIEQKLGVNTLKQCSCRKQQLRPVKIRTWQEQYNPPVEPRNIGVVCVEQCSTRSQGPILLNKFENLVRISTQFGRTLSCQQLRSVINQELQSYLPQLQRYILLAKCEQCHQDRSRVERELLRWNCDRFFVVRITETGYIGQRQRGLAIIHKFMEIIAQGMARVIRWCWQKCQVSDTVR